MIIENAKYVAMNSENTAIVATIDGVYSSVPLDPANRHYQAILDWVAAGNKIEEAD